MKRTSLYIGSALMAVSGLFSACSSDYLDVAPVTDVNDILLSEPSVMKTALAGLYESMNTNYSGIDLNQNCGEAYISYLFNDCTGIDLYSGLWNNPQMPGLDVWSRINQDSQWASGYVWSYYYGIIQQANRIIAAVPNDDAEGIQAASLFYKAQALTMRAHCYTKLLTYYGNRYEDVNGDFSKAYCVVLRLEPTTGAIPLATMQQVFDQVYADCEEAVKLFDQTKLERNAKYEVNINVANGTWARAALIKHDWDTAASKAEEAMKGFTVMDEKGVLSGFYADNNDFIWSMNPTEMIGYWSWGTHYACNGHYVNYWNFGAGSINIDLYNQLDKNDVRRKFFWMPDKLEALPKRSNPGNLKADAFWNPNIVDATTCLNTANGNVYNKNDKNTYGMVDCVVNWLSDYKNNVFTGDVATVTSEDGFVNYYFETIGGASNMKRAVRLANNAAGQQVYGTPVNVPFGAQCKFWGIAPFAVSNYPWMRASEMALTRAEALAEKGDASAAKVFEDFQKLRVPGYVCKTSGRDLIEEIRISRRIELWGEGDNFTSIKRWNMPHVLRAWVPNDPTSGNYPPGSSATEAMQSVTYSNGWRFAIPTREWQYNEEVDRTKLLPITTEKK